MNRSKVSALALIIICVTSVLSFTFYGSTIKQPETKPSNLLVWNETEIYTHTYLKVWKPFNQVTAVNQTTDTVFAYYTKGFDTETKQIQNLDTQTYIMSSEASTVYWNASAGDAIQWALNHAGEIIIDSGTYDIDRVLTGYGDTILKGETGTTILSPSDYFISLPNYTYNFSISNITFNDYLIQRTVRP